MTNKMPNEVLKNYSDARPLILDGDVLLFRGNSISSFFISRAGQGMHSHVGMASWYEDTLECVEFREFKGGRTVALRLQVEENDGNIDVFRPKPLFPVLESIGKYIDVGYNGHAATRWMRKMTGLPYGWDRIWMLAKYHLLGIRWFTPPNFDDKSTNGHVYPVCSTAIATAIRMGGYSGLADLRPLKSDHVMTPPDIASSPVLDYIFTLKKDW